MSRAYGWNASLLIAEETEYGVMPESGYTKIPFISSSLDSEQSLVASNVLGLGRDPTTPFQDVINVSGDMVVPIDVHSLGIWLKAIFGTPTSKPIVNEEESPTGNYEHKVTPHVDDNTYKKTVEDIQNKLLDLKTPYNKAIALADKWKSETLKGLDSTKSGYQQYKFDVERIYDDMIKKAKESALNSSKSLEDGFRRGFTSIREEAGNFANLAESTVKNAFSNMEDALTTFITTGKASFSDFANAIISDLTRIIIRQSITQPLLNGIASYFGFATAHTGGIVGFDNLRKTYASPEVFFYAPKFHGGGIVGDEVPIIAKRGEGVFTREQMKAIGDRESTVNISVNVINNASSDVKTSVTKSNKGNGKINLDIMIEKIENSMAKNVSKGTGLASVLERRYGLNPAYGSYG